MNVLFISYDGMTDPLGQSQVLPYLVQLSSPSVRIFLLSFEKEERFETQKNKILAITSSANITWVPLSYTKKPPVLSTLWDVLRMKRKAFQLQRQHGFAIVHCRSYISALAGLAMKKKFGTRFLFDMRGFYADERVDGGLWNLQNPLYKAIYGYFKRKEKIFLEQADHTISLTYAAREIMHGWKHLAGQPIPIEVIPCCVDLTLFNPEKVSPSQKQQLLASCDLTGNEFLLSYFGSLGTWYMLDEMLGFFKRLLLQKPNAVFLIVTQDNMNIILEKAKKLGIPPERFRLKKAAREEMPAYISLSNVSLFFIQPVFSKKASSPTKQGEIMAMGIPIVCNNSVGDTDRVIRQYNAGWVVTSFSNEETDRVIQAMNKLPDKNQIMQGAREFYSLEEGVKRYRAVYEKLI